MTVLSSDWRNSTLGEVSVSISNGIFARRPNGEGVGVPILRISAVRDGGVAMDDLRYVEGVEEEQIERYSIEPGNLLITRYNGSRHLVGIAGLVRDHHGPVLHPDKLIRIVLDQQVVQPRYVNLQLQSSPVRRYLEPRIRTSAGQSGIAGADVRGIPLVLPDLEEQRRIVAILEEHLSDLDAGLSYVDSATARLVHLRRAELDRIFGLGTGPTLPLGDLIADISAGKSFGSAERPAAPGEWGIIKVSAMTWGEFRPDENKAVSADRVDPRFEIRAGDLLVSRANTSDYVGASVLVPAGVRPKLLLSDKSLRVLPRPDINPEWLWRALQAPGARRQMSVLATGTKESMRNISQESLKRVVVPVVDGSEQGKITAEFAEIESAIRRQLGILASLRSRASGLRRAVLAAAFSGRLTGHGTDTELIEELAEEESA